MDYSIYLETQIGEDEWREDEYVLQDIGYVPYDPGRTSGPPDQCYPPEGGYAEVEGPVLYRENKQGKGVEISWTCFLERYATYHDLEDDPIVKRYRKTALEKAEEDILEEVYQACADREDDYEPDYDEPDDIPDWWE